MKIEFIDSGRIDDGKKQQEALEKILEMTNDLLAKIYEAELVECLASDDEA